MSDLGDLSQLTVKVLQKELENRGLDKKGRKAELVDRLTEALADSGDDGTYGTASYGECDGKARNRGRGGDDAAPDRLTSVVDAETKAGPPAAAGANPTGSAEDNAVRTSSSLSSSLTAAVHGSVGRESPYGSGTTIIALLQQEQQMEQHRTEEPWTFIHDWLGGVDKTDDMIRWLADSSNVETRRRGAFWDSSAGAKGGTTVSPVPVAEATETKNAEVAAKQQVRDTGVMCLSVYVSPLKKSLLMAAYSSLRCLLPH